MHRLTLHPLLRAQGGPWREASMAMLGMAFGLTKEQAEAAANGEDVLGQGIEAGEAAGEAFLRMWSAASSVGKGMVRRLSLSSSRQRGITAVTTSSTVSSGVADAAIEMSSVAETASLDEAESGAVAENLQQ